MHVPGLQNIQSLNLQHSDVLEKLKMQVGLMDTDFPLHALSGHSIPPGAGPNTPQTNGFPFLPPTVPHTKDGK